MWPPLSFFFLSSWNFNWKQVILKIYSMFLSLCLSDCSTASPFVYLSIYSKICQFECLLVCPLDLSFCFLSFWLSVHLSFWHLVFPISLSVCLSYSLFGYSLSILLSVVCLWLSLCVLRSVSLCVTLCLSILCLSYSLSVYSLSVYALSVYALFCYSLSIFLSLWVCFAALLSV